jgi:hypothetical protein
MTAKIHFDMQTPLRADKLPSGRLVVGVSQHFVAIIDGVIHDIYDCSRDGTRCVYGYYVKSDEPGDHDMGNLTVPPEIRSRPRTDFYCVSRLECV